MKKLWFRLLSLFGLPLHKTFLSGNNVPEVIHHKFFRLYPGAYNINWSVFRGIYEAHFANQDEAVNAFFKPNGEVFKEFKVIDIKELPVHIIKKITQGSSGHSVVDVLIDECNNNPKYKITFRKEKKLKEIEYDLKGNILRQVIL
ncbi:MAG: hypothetical protein ACJA2S_002220 [Cyclobacteriaceae bacterium]|jgi:hypothetical protein